MHALRLPLVALLLAASGEAQKYLFSLKSESSIPDRITGIGDIDADGTPDLLLIQGWLTDARIVSGANLQTIRELSLPYFPTAAGGPDVDGDGHADVLIGSTYQRQGAGEVTLYSGRTWQPLFRATGAAGTRSFGKSVQWIGDMDHDGTADFMTEQIGAGMPWTQTVICSGKTGKILWTIATVGALYPASSAGDLDGDGKSEILIRRHWGSSHGYFELYSSRTGKAVWRSELLDGWSTPTSCWPGDLDGDGVNDLAVNSRSALFAYSGKTGRRIFQKIDGLLSVFAVGDVNRDGVPDIGSSQGNNLVVHSGKDGQWILRVPIPKTGAFMTPVGDMDGDGTIECAIGFSQKESVIRVFSTRYIDPALQAFGKGCHATANPPRFTNAKRTARLGMALDLDLERLPGATTGWLWVGASDQSWSGGRLPLDLTQLGMPGCRLLVAPHIRVPFVSSGKTVRLRIQVPFEYACVGAPVFLQAFCRDKSANPLGVSTSPGLRGILWP